MKAIIIVITILALQVPFAHAQGRQEAKGWKSDGSRAGQGEAGTKWIFGDEGKSGGASRPSGGSITGNTPGGNHDDSSQSSQSYHILKAPAPLLHELPAGIEPSRAPAGTIRAKGVPPTDRQKQQDALNADALKAYDDYARLYESGKATPKQLGEALKKKRETEDAALNFIP